MKRKVKVKMPGKTGRFDVLNQFNDSAKESDQDFGDKSDENEKETEVVYRRNKSNLLLLKNKRKNEDVTSEAAPRKKKKLENGLHKPTPEFNQLGETENVASDAAPKKKKKSQSDLYKPPTAEELNQLRETENLFHSNLFRLQIEEMLTEIKIKDKYKRLFDTWFEHFKKTVESIEETTERQIDDLKDKLDVRIPMPDVPDDTQCTFKFLKPSKVAVIGSYAFDAVVGPNITVDVMIEMPARLFRNRDCHNYKYFKMKAMYLAHVASNIRDNIAESKKFVGDNLRPALKVVPTGKLGRKVNVLIHVGAQENSFKLSKFLPEKNNVRPDWFFGRTNSKIDLPPTPHYNSIILHDLTMARVNLESANVIKEYLGLRDGIILLKIWLTQRELIKGFDGFTGHVITMFTLYLLSAKKLNTFMSSYQIVRNVWNSLVQADWSENGISMSQHNDGQNRVSNYQKYYDCVFLDSTNYSNVAAYVSKATFSWVQREAELCLKHLDSAHADSFQSLFMRKVPFYKAFDHLICLKDTEALTDIVNTKSKENDKLDHGPDHRTLAVRLLGRLLTKGLTNRVHRICILPGDVKEWECTENNHVDVGQIFLGLELNPESCFTIVEKGPEANLPDAAAFRSFWGKKSELRRFQDGSIREAVVWSKGRTLSGKRIICKKIVTYLLTQKFGLRDDQFVYFADEIEELLKLPKVKITHFSYGTGEEATLQVLSAFDSLEKQLMSLTDIPLSIHGVQGSSAVFRYADVFPPLATVYRSDNKLIKSRKNCLTLSEEVTRAPRYVHPLEVSLQLSTSGKWPDELEAIRKTKAAFHVQIAECLRKQCMLVAHASYSHIDVLKEGLVFRLRVAHQKEVTLLKQQITEDGVTQYRDNEESIELETKLFELPKLSSALHGLHAQQPSFGSACCLMKRWLSAQLLDDFHIPDVVVELLVASMYLTPAPYKPPQMPQVAFLRLLEIFARGHWNTDPVIVNFNNEMSREEIIAVETHFGTNRSSLPPLFISTPYDQQKSLWTRKAPTALILKRITALAGQSLTLFEEQLSSRTMLDFKPLFRPAFTEYDCLIYLKQSMVPRKLQAVDVDERQPIIEWHPYKMHSRNKIPVVDFDPVQCFLKELRNGYDEFALFFYDTYGGLVIGVVLKPSALEVKDFKVSNVNCRKSDSDGKLILNVSTMIQDFYILGRDVVEAIEVRSTKFSLT